jgi:hypothetical protein
VTSTFFFDHTRTPSASEVSGLASALGAMFSSRGGVDVSAFVEIKRLPVICSYDGLF